MCQVQVKAAHPQPRDHEVHMVTRQLWVNSVSGVLGLMRGSVAFAFAWPRHVQVACLKLELVLELERLDLPPLLP